MPQLSYVTGASGPPLIDATIGRFFDSLCAANPDRLALVARHQNVRWTFSELQQRVDAFATGLLALGLAAGDRVGIWAPNCWEWLVTQYATAKAGLILVNVNPAYQRAEAEYALNIVGCKALITASQHKTSNYVEMLQGLAPELAGAAAGQLSAKRLPHLRLIAGAGALKDLFLLRRQKPRCRSTCHHSKPMRVRPNSLLAPRRSRWPNRSPFHLRPRAASSRAPAGRRSSAVLAALSRHTSRMSSSSAPSWSLVKPFLIAGLRANASEPCTKRSRHAKMKHGFERGRTTRLVLGELCGWSARAFRSAAARAWTGWSGNDDRCPFPPSPSDIRLRTERPSHPNPCSRYQAVCGVLS